MYIPIFFFFIYLWAQFQLNAFLCTCISIIIICSFNLLAPRVTSLPVHHSSSYTVWVRAALPHHYLLHCSWLYCVLLPLHAGREELGVGATPLFVYFWGWDDPHPHLLRVYRVAGGGARLGLWGGCWRLVSRGCLGINTVWCGFVNCIRLEYVEYSALQRSVFIEIILMRPCDVLLSTYV